jgi:acetylornithine deacetylase/succinyl-diaminopimelate desuccinylase-like protein
MATRLIALLSALLLSLPALAVDRDSEHARKALDIFTRIIAMETSKNLGNVPGMASYLADELKAAGFQTADVEVLPAGETAALVVTYRGDGSSGKPPIAFLAHMDVVEALASDWERPPFELTRDDEYFYARGTDDNKFGVAQLVATFIRLKKDGYVPNRDLILAFSGDEETGMETTKMLAQRPDLLAAEFALNSDAGGGRLDDDRNPVVYAIQAAEKTYATWEVTVRNPGGHSSRPRADNAIYELAAIIRNIQAYQFPVEWTEMTLQFFDQTGRKVGGELGEAMIRFANNPKDEAAIARLAKEPEYVGSTRTTCVVTMLDAGHAENALPQSATATVNCRIFPGTPVADVQAVLDRVADNPEAQWVLLGDPTESPVSQLRADVRDAVAKAVHARYPGLELITYMESGGTDGMHFRSAGIPTWGVGGIFINPRYMFAHGLNERVLIDSFYGALDHWSIIIKELAGQGQPAGG